MKINHQTIYTVLYLYLVTLINFIRRKKCNARYGNKKMKRDKTLHGIIYFGELKNPRFVCNTTHIVGAN